MISVCMATYNGALYIQKQLVTIYEQTLKADEVIICDDCSTDGTVNIIKKFIEERQLQNCWKLYINDSNKGYPQNFYYAMSLCQGDIVFLADQDDLWEKDKLKDMDAIMESNKNIGLLASRWGIIDKDDTILKKVSSGKVKKKRECKQITIHDILYYYDWPGMCMCYRKQCGDMVLARAKDTRIPHDVALGLLMAEENGFYCLNQVEQYHRRHEANAAMEEHRVSKLLNKNRKVQEIKRYLKWLQSLLDSKCLKDKDNISIIEYKRAIMKERLENLEKGRRIRMIKQYVDNKRYIRLSTLVCDLLIGGKE